MPVAPASIRPDRRSRAAATAALAGLLAVLGGGAPASAQGTPARPTSTAGAAAPAAVPLPPNADAAASPIVSLSASGGRIAALRILRPADERGHGTYELLVGDASGLRRAPGVAPLVGSQYQPPKVHLGTNARGRPVAIFPRCALRRQPLGDRSYLAVVCDLASYDLTFGGEHRLPGVRRAGRSEDEGVMDRGALLFAAGSLRTADSGLRYRPSGGRERRIARIAGRDLALQGSRIAHVISDGAKEAGEEPCTNSTLVVRSTRGARRVVARDCVYEYASAADRMTAPAFDGGYLTWSAGRLYRQELRTRRVEDVSLRSAPYAYPAGAFAFAPTSSSAGLVVVQPGIPGTASSDDLGEAVVALAGIPWKRRTSPVIKSVQNVDPRALD